jgi:hypothetical protein
MKEFRITTQNLTQSSSDDCYIDPSDPMWEMMGASQLGGLGSENLLVKYRLQQLPQVKQTDKGQVARELGLKPGTEDWFKHWFGDKK